jgi:glycerol-3-phosphate dehydrogenase
MVPRRAWGDLDGLTTQGLKAVFRYWDAQTDDAALTRAVWRSAAVCGARLLCPADFVSASDDGERLSVRYRQGEAAHEITASVLVNAAGPWVNRVLDGIDPAPSQLPVALVQGTHVLLPGPVERGIYYMEAADRRAVFVMPWQGRALVGTTETVYAGDPADVAPTPHEVDYLLAVYRRYFPHREATMLDSFAGLRVLPAGGGSPFSRSRGTVLHVDRQRAQRVLSIYGGKLTGYRATAEKALRRLTPILGPGQAGISTRELPLPTGD